MNESLYGRSNIGKVVHLMRRLGTELMLLAGYDSSTVFVRIYNHALFLLKCALPAAQVCTTRRWLSSHVCTYLWFMQSI